VLHPHVTDGGCSAAALVRGDVDDLLRLSRLARYPSDTKGGYGPGHAIIRGDSTRCPTVGCAIVLRLGYMSK
jgi:hypothetical protein